MTGQPGCDPIVVALPAEIDTNNSTTAWASLLDALDNPGLIIADMSGTAFCDSSGVRVLLAAHDRANANGSELRIVIKPGSAVTRVLAIMGLDRIFRIYASFEDAVPARSCGQEPGSMIADRTVLG
jgi:anti-sigma B factor antagonist